MQIVFSITFYSKKLQSHQLRKIEKLKNYACTEYMERGAGEGGEGKGGGGSWD